jgi:hypothetical protein
MEKEKHKIEEHLDSLMQNKIVRTTALIALSIGGLYVLSKVFKVVGNTVTSFKEMTDSFKS